MDAAVERRMTGQAASPGVAAGPVVHAAPTSDVRADAGDPSSEGAALRAAIGQAVAELESLSATVPADAADMLAFQIAMLEDEALSEGAFHAIEAGMPADHAWRRALDAEIEGYEAAEDEYFRARAADLADIRNRVLRRLSGADAVLEPAGGAILAADDLGPSAFLAMDWTRGGGIALARGSASSHVAMLARARGVPMVVGLGELPPAGVEALIDGVAGTIVLSPGHAARNAFMRRQAELHRASADARRYLTRPAVSRDGIAIGVMVNVGDPDEMLALDPAICDGIGLVRTEFLFDALGGMPDEERQVAAYRRLLVWADGRPVTIRTLDAGGDKPIAGLTAEGESNPFLGLRGIRLSLARPDVFRVQLAAMARAAVEGDLKIMIPMVAVPDELAATRTLLDEEIARLAAAGVPARRPPLGMMVEVPAAALRAADFPADFYSIGSNDLTQYTMAAARDIGAVAGLNDAGNPAVLDLIRATVVAGRRRGVEVSLCGDAAADTAALPGLLSTGLDRVSVAPVAVARVKAAISDLDLAGRPSDE